MKKNPRNLKGCRDFLLFCRFFLRIRSSWSAFCRSCRLFRCFRCRCRRFFGNRENLNPALRIASACGTAAAGNSRGINVAVGFADRISFIRQYRIERIRRIGQTEHHISRTSPISRAGKPDGIITADIAVIQINIINRKYIFDRCLTDSRHFAIITGIFQQNMVDVAGKQN